MEDVAAARSRESTALDKTFIAGGTAGILATTYAVLQFIDKRKIHEPDKLALLPFFGIKGTGLCVTYEF